MAGESNLKPVIWVGSSRRDLRAFPEPVQDHIGYALYVAQRGGTHRDTKPLVGLGGGRVIEVIKDHRGDTFRAVYSCISLTRFMCSTRFKRSRKLASQHRGGNWN